MTIMERFAEIMKEADKLDTLVKDMNAQWELFHDGVIREMLRQGREPGGKGKRDERWADTSSEGSF